VYPVNAFFTTTVDINVADLAYDSAHNRFYVTVPTGGSRPNAPAETVVSIDANTGAIGPHLSVGPKPTTLAVSDDGSYLYVYLAGSATIVRIALATFTQDIQFPLTGSNQFALAMAVRPGSPGTLAVSQSTGANSGRVVIYDDGKSRSQTSPDLIAANLLFADPFTIVTGGFVSPMNLLIFLGSDISDFGQFQGSGQQEIPLAVTPDTLFSSRGWLYSVKTTRFLGNLETSGAAAFVPGRNRLLIGGSLGSNNGTSYLAAFDPTSLTPLGRMTVGALNSAMLGNFGARLVRWGTDGVAFVSGQNLFIGHTPLAGPAPVWTAAGTVNTASGTTGAIAPGEILSIYGSNVGPTPGRSLEFSAYRRVSTNLGGTEVWFDGLPGTMLYAGAGQVNVVAPFGLAGKSSTKVQLWYGGIPSAQITLPVVGVSPGIFTLDGSGKGPAALLNSDGSVNSAAHPAPAGTYATLFGTGGGLTQPASHDGEPASADGLVAGVRVLLSGQSVPVIYAGSAPGLVAGVIQVNFQIPAGFPASPAVNLQLEVAGVASTSGATMAVQ
jgi:uncharacterized protein (TIGR03437 family)